MRGVAFALLLPLVAVGCGPAREVFDALSAPYKKLDAGFASDQTLIRDLAKDFQKQSEALEFVSDGTYSCGYTSDRQRIAQVLAPKLKENTAPKKASGPAKDTEFHTNTNKRVLTKIRQLDAVIGYGLALSDIISENKQYDEDLDRILAGARAYSGLAATDSSGELLKAAVALIGLAKMASDQAKYNEIYRLAKKEDPHLKANVAQIKRDKLPQLNAEEALIFSLWNSCAREKLSYLKKDYATLYKGSRVRQQLRGMVAASTVEFTNAYAGYIEQREAFLARKADFGALLDDIVDANTKIVESGGDPRLAYDELLAAAKAAVDANTKTEEYRRAYDAYRNSTEK